MTTAISDALNSAERSRLRVCEGTIQKHLATFVDVGTALAEIRDSHLYRESHKTFEAYVKSKWDFEKRYAYRLIAAAGVVENCVQLDTKPSSEAMARPLAELPPKQRPEAFTAAVERAREQGKPVTAAIVEEVVEELKPCHHCGETDKDEDGDCVKCHEPAGKNGKAKTVKVKAASPSDSAKAQINVWSATIGRWLGQSPSIDELRASFPGKRGDAVVKLATDLYEALKVWEKAIH